ncbi:MAG TPA: hypothetical protein VK783_00915 [Bacteroidia bacterium]|jgi:hypothetical protein|nr:hypothetical protein [Bacteroidia bacterium]
MRPVRKRPKTEKELERSIKYLLLDQEQFDSIKPDGSLDETFILSYLVRNNDHAAKEYGRILRAYEIVKKHGMFTKVMESRRVSDKTLQGIELYYESIVRPIKAKEDGLRGHIYTGEVLKLPSPAGREYDTGEEWKALLEKEKRFMVGDKVLYNMKSNLILDNELLHLVGTFTGKISA